MKCLFVVFILIHASQENEIEDLMSPCSIQHGCCIQLCSALDPGLGLRGLSDVGSDGCCPPSDPCGDLLESGNCMLCNCEALEEYDTFDTLRSAFGVENDTDVGVKLDEAGIDGLERESGKGFDDVDSKAGPKTRSAGLEFLTGLVFENLGRNSSNTSTGGIGLRSSLDFAFDKIEEEEGEEVTYLKQCCPSPSEPCNIQHSCCIQLCSALEPGLRVRGLSEVGSDGCCPDSDPCGEQLESGNCIQCDCHYDYDTLPQGDSLRSAFSVNMDNSEYKDYGIERESGQGFEALQVKVGITSNGLDREIGETFDRVNRDSGPAEQESEGNIIEEGSGNATEYNNAGDCISQCKLSFILTLVLGIVRGF
eukprot:GFUD01063419.1.p1 GENE.GFUD01063419.1~~GFUD01063419.1.p1  ORF type:complete len:365 (+),score=98.65 GFUD01063419.1:293-1387(+)